MAFDKTNLKCLTFPGSIKELSLRSYTSTTDAIATIKAANYFATGGVLRVGDLILTKGTDGAALLMVATVTADANETVSAITVTQGTFA
jgi:hypothetical protein